MLSNPNELRYQLDVEIQNGAPDDRSIISRQDIILMPYSIGIPLFEKNQVTLI